MAQQWIPPDYATPVTEEDDYTKPPVIKKKTEEKKPVEEPKKSLLRRAWNFADTPLTNAPTRLADTIAEPLMQYGEMMNDIPHNIARYSGAFLHNFGEGVTGLTRPDTLALMGTSVAARELASAASAVPEAGKAVDFARKIRLMQIAKALETPGRVASGAMVAHGGYRMFDADNVSDRASGATEAALGVMGLRSRVNVPRAEVLPAEETGLTRVSGSNEPINVSANKENLLENKKISDTYAKWTRDFDKYGKRIYEEVKANNPHLTPRELADEAHKATIAFVGPEPPKPDYGVTKVDKGELLSTDPNFNQGQGDAELAGSIPYTNKPRVRINSDGTYTNLDTGKTVDAKGTIIPEVTNELPAGVTIDNTQPRQGTNFLDKYHQYRRDTMKSGITPMGYTDWHAKEEQSKLNDDSDIQFHRALPDNKPSRFKIQSTEDSFLEKGNNTEKQPEGILDKQGRVIAPPQKDLPETRQLGLNEDWTPPDYAVPHEEFEPTHAKTEGGIKIGADIESLGKILGSSLYKGNITHIATKELLQNSIDAIRHLGKEGQIHVEFNEGSGKDDGSLLVKDNGKGLTKQELETVFTDLGSSGKRNDESATGGFGLAKAAPLLGGKRVEITSYAKESDGKIYMHTFGGTPEELIKGVNVNSVEMPEGTKTGTNVKVTINKDQFHLYDAKEFAREVAESSPALKGNIKLVHNYKSTSGRLQILDDKTHSFTHDLNEADSKTLSGNNADVDIIIPKGTEYGPSPYGVRYKMLNNGMYQGRGAVGTMGEVPGIPKNILVNIRPKVAEGHTDYPFTANREYLRGDAEKIVAKYIEDNIIKPGIGKRIEQLKNLYENVPFFTNDYGEKIQIYDAGQRLSPDEMKTVTTNLTFRKMSDVIDDALWGFTNQLNEIHTNLYGNLDKTGIILDSGIHGIHIPNPGESKSMILINPFNHIQNSTPDNAVSGISHTLLHEIAHMPGGGHDEHFTMRLGQIYNLIGRKNIRILEDQLYDAVTINGKYSPELQNLLSLYSESRRREPAPEDPLYGTGISSRNSKSKGKGKVPGNNNPNGKGTPVDKLIAALNENKINRNQQDQLYSEERSVRAGKISGVKTLGLKGYYQRAGMLKGELPKIDSSSQLTEQDVDGLLDTVQAFDALKPYEKFRAQTGLVKLLSGKTLQHSEINLIAQVFGKNLGETILLNSGIPIGNIVNNVVNLPKTLMSTADMSAPLRQGLPLIHTNEYWNAFSEMFKYYGDEKAFQASQQAITERPKFERGEKAGLHVSDINDDLEQREEQFLSAYADNIKIPVLKIKPIRASNRAYTGFLNQLRTKTFDNLTDLADKAYPNDMGSLDHEIAKFVNNATGRGHLGKYGERVAVPLNAVFFSPRLISSRLTLLNPMYYIKSSPFVRQQHLKSLLAIAGVALTTAALTKLAGGKVSLDPTSSDFMKGRFGNTRIDPMGGFQQPIVAGMRLVSGRMVSTNGTVYNLNNSKYPQPTRLSVVQNFGRSKESPVASFVDTMLQGQQGFKPGGLGGMIGSNRPSAEIINRFSPMLTNDLIDVYKSDPSLLPLGLPAAFGMSLQTMDDTPTGGSYRINTGIRTR